MEVLVIWRKIFGGGFWPKKKGAIEVQRREVLELMKKLRDAVSIDGDRTIFYKKTNLTLYY